MPIPLTRECFLAFFDAASSDYTVTPSNFTPVSGFELDNLKTGRLDSHARSPYITTSTMLFDLGAPTEINCIMFAGCNCTASVLRRFSAADDADITSGVVQSGSGLDTAIDMTLGHSRAVYVPSWGRNLIHVLNESITKRYVQWEQSDETNPLPYQEWAAARIGLGYQLPMARWSIGKRYRTNVTAGQRVHDVWFTLLTREQMYTLESIARTVNKRRVLFIPEPSNPQTWQHDAIWCTVEEVSNGEAMVGTAFRDKRWSCRATFVEATR